MAALRDYEGCSSKSATTPSRVDPDDAAAYFRREKERILEKARMIGVDPRMMSSDYGQKMKPISREEYDVCDPDFHRGRTHTEEEKPKKKEDLAKCSKHLWT